MMSGILHLFEGYGIELEYMIVDKDSIAINPVTDKILHDIDGSFVNEVDRGLINWSNELVLHVIELKTNGPVKTIVGLEKEFHKQLLDINNRLQSYDSKLMAGAMHPTMDPISEMHLWPHEYNPIYESFNKIFSCKGHGWANLQSMHINLPFGDDLEFGKLHAAIRLVLPIIPALSSSSPISDGKISGFHDTRLEVYRTNSKKIPSITGDVIPEPVFTSSEYQHKILEPIYKDLAPYDPEGILQDEWVNARGAIARFERNTIEIRVIDIQECPQADIAIAAAVIGLVRALVEESVSTLEEQKKWEVPPLKKILLDVIRTGESTVIDNRDYLKLFGMHLSSATAKDLWKHIILRLVKLYPPLIEPYYQTLLFLLDKGSLSTRLLNVLGKNPQKEHIASTYHALCQCIVQNKLFGN